LDPRHAGDAAGRQAAELGRGNRRLYRDPAFWRLAPLSSMVIGTAFALHGLGRAVDGRR
jgi:hypothetical protein